MTFHGERWSFSQVCQVYRWLYEKDYQDKPPNNWQDIPGNVLSLLEIHRKKVWKRLVKEVPIALKRRMGLICSVESCGRPANAEGLCMKHYNRRNLYGNELTLDELIDRGN